MSQYVLKISASEMQKIFVWLMYTNINFDLKYKENINKSKEFCFNISNVSIDY